jgi:hypothetical protein
MIFALAACTFAVMLVAGKPGGRPPYMMRFETHLHTHDPASPVTGRSD